MVLQITHVVQQLQVSFSIPEGVLFMQTHMLLDTKQQELFTIVS